MKKIALFLIAIITLVACGEQTPTGGKIESLTLNPSTLELKVGAEKKIRTSVTPATDEVYTVVWESSDETVATVDNKGNVVAVAAGNATITATIKDTEISATAAVTVVSPFDALKFYTLALMGMNETPYFIEGVDNNQDEKADTLYAVTFYVLPETMYIQDRSLVGEDDYMMIMNTSLAILFEPELGGRVAYSLGGYGFAEAEEDYLAECTDGVKRLKPHMASFSHFNQERYLDFYTKYMSQEDFDGNADIAENGYWLGDFDSYIAYVNFEYQAVVDGGFIVGGAGLETSSEGYDLAFYEFQLKMFEKPYAYGLATQMVEDEETGEMVETFVWPLEMGNMIEKTYTYGEPSSAEPEEVQARAMQYSAQPLSALKKQIAINNALFTSLKVAFAK